MIRIHTLLLKHSCIYAPGTGKNVSVIHYQLGFYCKNKKQYVNEKEEYVFAEASFGGLLRFYVCTVFYSN